MQGRDFSVIPERTHTLRVSISPERIADRANERFEEYIATGDRAIEERVAQGARVAEQLEERIGERIGERIAHVGRLGESIGGSISEQLAHRQAMLRLAAAVAARVGARGYPTSTGSPELTFSRPAVDQKQQHGAPTSTRPNAPARIESSRSSGVGGGPAWTVPEVRVDVFLIPSVSHTYQG